MTNAELFRDVNPRIAPGMLASQVLTQVDGFGRMRRELQAKHKIRVAECAQVWDMYRKHKISPLLMQEAFNLTDDLAFRKLNKLAPNLFSQEAMTMSDFSNLTTFVLDRIMMEAYPTVPATFEQLAYINRDVKDFRSVERWVTDNGEGVWNQVQEMEGLIQHIKEDTAKYTYSVKKYEKAAFVSWEAMINDDMGQFTDLPTRLAAGGKRTIEHFFLSLIADASGPHASFYGSAISMATGGTVNNVIDLSGYGGTVNPKLNAENLIAAVGLFMNMMTYEGRPISVNDDVLNVVVADGVLYQTLMQIMNTSMIASTILGGSKSASNSVPADMTLMANNWIRGRINPVYAPELRNIMTSNTQTAWWLFVKPARARPAVEIGFLRGFDTPQMYRKKSNTERISGGFVDEMGDFNTMSTEIKGLVIPGGTRMDPRMTMGSDGTEA